MLQNQIKTIFLRALKKSDSQKELAFCENFLVARQRNQK